MNEHTQQGYKGTIIYECANNKWQVRYEIKSDELASQLLNQMIPAYCEKKIQDYIDDLPNRCIIYKNSGVYHTLVIQAPSGNIKELNNGISAFVVELDIFLHYYLMDLSSFGKHFKIFHDAVREKGQWHWLQEKPNYDSLIIK